MGFLFISHGNVKFTLHDGREDALTQWANKETYVLGLRLARSTSVSTSEWISLEDDTPPYLISIAFHHHNRNNPDEERISPASFGCLLVQFK